MLRSRSNNRRPPRGLTIGNSSAKRVEIWSKFAHALTMSTTERKRCFTGVQHVAAEKGDVCRLIRVEQRARIVDGCQRRERQSDSQLDGNEGKNVDERGRFAKSACEISRR
jgi:hypothetical protein